MRRNITLYIDGKRADINEDNLVLMNYAVTEVEKPTAVKNSYSKQITIPGTPANDAIFGFIYRLDMAVAATGFNPLVRTPFEIFSDTGEVLQSGYLKLDRIDRAGVVHTYTISLYGGLGSLMYGLTYGDDGEKLSLANLPFSVADGSFYFTINKDSVAKAWERLYNGANEALWDIVNFVPCYNGLPSDLSSDKARLQGDYTTIVSLSRKYNEWETRDLRSHLQRPALRVRKVIEAIVSAAAEKGKTISLDADFFNNNNPYYDKAWMLLPLLTNYQNAQAGPIGEPSSVTQEMNCQVLDEIPMGAYFHLTGTTFSSDANGKIDLSSFDPSFYMKGNLTLCLNVPGYAHKYLNYWDGTKWKGVVVGVQVIITDGYGHSLAISKPYLFGNWTSDSDERVQSVLSSMAGDTTIWYAAGNDIWHGDSTSVYFSFDNVPVAAGDNIRIMTNVFASSSFEQMGESEFRLFDSDADGTQYDTGEIFVRCVGGQFSLESPGSVGSGTTITKSMLLADTGTPADFLLSYCRQFGLRIVETAPDTISILTLNNFYNGGIIDLTSRIDRGQMKVTPLVFTKKWQRLGLEIPETSIAKEYSKHNGKEFGNINLDTGLEFNAEKEELMAGSVFKGGIYGRWASPLLYNYVNGGNYVCPALLGGYEKEGTMIFPSYTGRTPLNADYPGYDMTGKVFGFNLDGGEQKAVDIGGTLVFFAGIMRNPGMWFLSNNYAADDVCWQVVVYNDTYSTKVVNFPVFSRYVEDADGVVLKSLDFGTPAEVYDPSLTITPDSSIYTRFWEAFARDRFDKSNKVLVAKVDLTGLQVGPSLLRKFFYYEGVYWVLNKITNYSLTTWDLVECEFIQVQDMDNYTNGQILN